MKRLSVMAVVFSLIALGAAAQEVVTNVMKKATFSYVPVGVMGNVVKGAPYAADEITESLQVLSDGTRISNQSQVTVYRDGEGRVRRESPTQITIWDPVANVSYTLDPKTMTGMKSTMGRTSFGVTNPTPQRLFYFSAAGTTVEAATAETRAAAEKLATAAMLDKLKAEAQAKSILVNGAPATPQTADSMKETLNSIQQKLTHMAAASKSESLGQQIMQGLTVDGTRTTTTTETGAIGNDRPINVVSERWYSNELQTVVLTRRTDPRTGEETFRLTNVRSGEPGPHLFMVPPGYQLTDNAAPKMMLQPVKKEE
jgi:hypothetical protein